MKIAIASGKGGTGKTTVAANLFEALRIEGNIAVDIIDTNVGEPNIYFFMEKSFAQAPEIDTVNVRIPVFDSTACTFCGRCVHFCEYDAILMVKESKHISLIDNLCKSCGACVYACNDGAITETNKAIGITRVFKDGDTRLLDGRLNIGYPFVTPIIQNLKSKIITEKISIIDTPPGTSRNVVEALYDADFVVIISESSLFGLHDLQLMVQMLNGLRKDFGVVINRYHGEHTIIQDYLEKNKISLLMKMPFKKEYAKYYSDGELLINKEPELKSGFLELFENIKSSYLQKALYR